jgi:ankyrin repeat protein
MIEYNEMNELMINNNINKVSISKDYIIHPLYKNSYFDVIKNTLVGSENTEIKFTLDELFILILPYINFNISSDKFNISKNSIVEILLEHIIDLDYSNMDILNIEVLYKMNKDICNNIFKKQIEKSEKYDFLNILTILDEENITFTDKKNNNILLWLCINKKNDEALKLIETFNEKCNPQQVNDDKNTVLILACKNKMENIALKLIDTFNEKCNPQQINEDKNTALILACNNKMENVALKLINIFKENCNPQYVDNNGNTILILACKNKMENNALKLIDTFGEKCVPNQITQNGNTALIWACKNEMEDVALKLIDTFGELCYPQQFNNNGNTALILTCNNNMENVALKLIDNIW